MRKYENVDVVAALGAVMEINTEFYKSDFKYDKEMFERAAAAPDGENNHLLWLSRSSGTECFQERDVYMKGIHAHNAWCYYAGQQDSICAYAVHITGMEDGKVMGDLYRLDYPRHVEQVRKDSVPAAFADVKFERGYEARLPFDEYTNNFSQYVAMHGRLISNRFSPEDEGNLNAVLTNARAEREKYRAAVFKVRIRAEKPSIEKQLREKQTQAKAVQPKTAQQEIER